jgi:Flp pilus assembly protein protease CpaA
MFGLVVIAATLNIRHYLVPIYIFAGILLLYPIMVSTAPFPVNWPAALIISGTILVLGYPLFTMGLLSSTDVKLISLLGLWAGPGLSLKIFLLILIASAVLAFVAFSKEGLKQSLEGTGFTRGIKFALRSNTQVPFGLAIVLGALGILLSYEQIINLSL